MMHIEAFKDELARTIDKWLCVIIKPPQIEYACDNSSTYANTIPIVLCMHK